MSCSLVKLEMVCDVNPRLPKDIDESQNVSFLTMSAVSVKGKILNQETRVLSETKKGFTYFERDDILLAKITPCFENGKAVLTSELKNQIGYGSTEFHVLRPIIEKMNGTYLFYLVWNDIFRFYGQHSMKGAAGQKRVTADFLKNFKIPLPPLPEQQKIAAILDAADTLRKKDQQLIDHYTELSQSLFLEMFGDPVTNPKGYEQRTLLELTNKITDGTHHTPTYNESGVPFLRVTDVTESNDSKKYISLEEHEELIKRCHPERNDILYTKNGTIGVGKIVDWDFDFSIFVSLCLLKPKHNVIEVKYLNHFLNTPFAIRQAMRHSKEATIKNLHLVEIRKMKIPYPSREEQKLFVSKLEKIQTQKHQAQSNLKNSQTLFNSLLQSAFKGELTGSEAA